MKKKIPLLSCLGKKCSSIGGSSECGAFSMDEFSKIKKTYLDCNLKILKEWNIKNAACLDDFWKNVTK